MRLVIGLAAWLGFGGVERAMVELRGLENFGVLEK